mgnify:CR=1 FL=1
MLEAYIYIRGVDIRLIKALTDLHPTYNIETTPSKCVGLRNLAYRQNLELSIHVADLIYTGLIHKQKRDAI